MLKKGLHAQNAHHCQKGMGGRTIMEIENNCANYKGKQQIEMLTISVSCQDVILPIIDNMNKGGGNKKGRELFSAF